MRLMAIALIISLGTLNIHAQEGTAWRKVADGIPLGAKVKIQTLGGRRLGGTLMQVDDRAVMIKKNTRTPEPAVIVTYDQIANLEREHGAGMTWGKAIGLGIGAGAGAILTILVIALQLD